jgi:hypothetical protein
MFYERNYEEVYDWRCEWCGGDDVTCECDEVYCDDMDIYDWCD